MYTLVEESLSQTISAAFSTWTSQHPLWMTVPFPFLIRGLIKGFIKAVILANIDNVDFEKEVRDLLTEEYIVELCKYGKDYQKRFHQ